MTPALILLIPMPPDFHKSRIRRPARTNDLTANRFVTARAAGPTNDLGQNQASKMRFRSRPHHTLSSLMRRYVGGPSHRDRRRFWGRQIEPGRHRR